ncbi:MAG: hypothetical protein DRP82_00900 [Planctomycetota bacterium]|nr:MAG: hypothetical protein DRP82_00900 [Planctomycetota bacterium]
MLRCFMAVVVPVFVFGQVRHLRVEEVKGRAWLVFSGRRQRLEVGEVTFGVTIECERGAKAKIAMPDGSYAVLLPPPPDSRTTRATFGRTSKGKDAVFLEEGTVKALFATKRFCVVGKEFVVEPLAEKRSGKKFLAEGIVRLLKKKESCWSVFAVADSLKVLLSDSGAEITIPEDEIAVICFLEKEKRWRVKADEANEKNITLRGRDGVKKDLAPNRCAEVFADKEDKATYGLIVPSPPPPEMVLRRERHLQLPVDSPYEDAGEVLEAPYVTPKKPEER